MINSFALLRDLILIELIIKFGGPFWDSRVHDGNLFCMQVYVVTMFFLYVAIVSGE